jgi:abortive infection bacteriophage resistance protein
VEKQLNRLLERGLSLGDGQRADAERLLLDTNYYRLSGYWRYFQIDPEHNNDAFQPNVTFNDIVEFVEMDALMRNILLKGLAVFEIAFRSHFAYYATVLAKDPCIYDSAGSYKDIELPPLTDGSRTIRQAKPLDKLLDKIHEDIGKSKDDCIEHFRMHDKPIPMWAAIEVLSFGTVSQMFELWADSKCKSKVANSFEGFGSWSKFESVPHALSVLRNICAHHGRLWNRIMPVTPVMLEQVKDRHEKQSAYRNTVWSDVVMLQFYVDSLAGNTAFSESIKSLLADKYAYVKGLKHPFRRDQELSGRSKH